MANNTWSNYTEKTATPVNADEVMVRDSTDGKNKRLLFGTFWKWVAKKLNEATISELQTDNKTIIGAINALNSETSKTKDIYIYKINTGNKTKIEIKGIHDTANLLFLGSFNTSSAILMLHLYKNNTSDKITENIGFKIIDGIISSVKADMTDESTSAIIETNSRYSIGIFITNVPIEYKYV